MKLRADTFLAQGYSHYICEDYILHGVRPEGPFVVLADGCSSAKNTDVGARLICYAAARYLQDVRDLPPSVHRNDMVRKIMSRAMMSAEIVGIDMSCLHATLLIMHTNGDNLYVNGWGDGHMIVTSVDGTSKHFSVSFPREMPWYPLYHVTPALNSHYMDITADDKVLLSPDLRNKMMDSFEDEYCQEGLREYVSLQPRTTPITYPFGVASVTIASDGLGSFLNVDDKPAGPMDPKGIAAELLAFKSTNGDFLKRRAGKTIKRYKTNSGDRYDHYDDLSIGTIVVEPD